MEDMMATQAAQQSNEPLGADLTSADALKIIPIERRSASGLGYDRFLSEYVVKNRPVIIEGAASDWQAVAQWTPEWFRTRFGDRQVNVTYGVTERLDTTIDAVLRSTREKPGPYLHKVIIYQHLPELLPDLVPENLYGYPLRYCSPLMPAVWKRPDGYLKLLIGGVGGKFPIIHYDTDNANALITEIYGFKEFVLFSPADTPYLGVSEESRHTSPINDLDNPDLDRFPLFSKATQLRGVVGPGEAMYVPSGWWHSARVVTTSISVCVNMMHSSNWNGFVDEACDPAVVPSRIRRLAKRIYLTAIGLIMSLAETAQQRYPGNSVSRRLAALSPMVRKTDREASQSRA